MSEEIEIPDYRELCRLCLSKQEMRLPIFGADDDKLGSLSERIQACISLKVSGDDDLPKHICHRCECQLNVWHYFKEHCYIVQDQLKSWAEKRVFKNTDEADGGQSTRSITCELEVKVETHDNNSGTPIPSELHGEVEIEEYETHDNNSETPIPSELQGEVEIEEYFDEPTLVHVDTSEKNDVFNEEEIGSKDCNENPKSFPEENSSQSAENELILRIAVPYSDVEGQNGCSEKPKTPELHNEVEYFDESTLSDVNATERNATFNQEEGNEIEDCNDITQELTEENASQIDKNAMTGVNEAASVSENYSTVSAVAKEEQIEVECLDYDDLPFNADVAVNYDDDVRIVFEGSHVPEFLPEVVDVDVGEEMEEETASHYQESDANVGVDPLGNLSSVEMKREALDNWMEVQLHQIENGTLKVKQERLSPTNRVLRRRKSSASVSNADRREVPVSKDKKAPSRNSKTAKSNTKIVQVPRTPPPINENMKRHRFSSHKLPKLSNALYNEAKSYCKQCKKALTPDRFWRHMKEKHKNLDPFKCNSCKVKFPSRSELFLHRIKTVVKACRQGVESKIDYSVIVVARTSGKKKIYECRTCKKTCVKFDNISSHATMHNGVQPYFCYKCFVKEFHSRKAALNHVKSCRGVVKNDGPGLKNSEKTSKPTATTTTSSPKLEVSERLCPKCGKNFKSGAGLSSHLKSECVSKCSVCLKMIPSVAFKQHTKMCKINKSLKKGKGIPISNIVDASVGELLSMHLGTDGKLPDMTCKLCNNTLSTRKSFLAHLQKHSGRRYRCGTCLISMQKRSMYEEHMKKYHPQPDKKPDAAELEKLLKTPQSNFKCDVCCKSFQSSSSLNKHRVMHKMMECRVCYSKFPAKLESSHKCFKGRSGSQPSTKIKVEPVDSSRSKKDKKLKCTMCDKTFLTTKLLNAHKKVHLYPKKAWNGHRKIHLKLKIYKCNACDNSYPKLTELLRHKKSAHKIGTGSGTEWKCDRCQKHYSSSHSLVRHKKLHETSVKFAKSDDVFNCQKCEKEFNSFLGYNSHMHWHKRSESSLADQKPSNASAKAAENSCYICHKSFQHKKGLAAHFANHIKKLNPSSSNNSEVLKGSSVDSDSLVSKPAPLCPLCPYTCKTNLALVIHMKTHDSKVVEDLFQQKSNEERTCKICGKLLTTRKGLKRHLMTHEAGSEAHKCRWCAKPFSSEKMLTMHENEHDIRPFSCFKCKTSFSKQEELMDHCEKCTH